MEKEISVGDIVKVTGIDDINEVKAVNGNTVSISRFEDDFFIEVKISDVHIHWIKSKPSNEQSGAALHNVN